GDLGEARPLQLHAVGAGLAERAAARDGLLRRPVGVEREVADDVGPHGPVAHGPDVVRHHLEGRLARGGVAELYLGERVADEDEVDAGVLEGHCRRVVVGREHRQGAAALRGQDLVGAQRGVRHDSGPHSVGRVAGTVASGGGGTGRFASSTWTTIGWWAAGAASAYSAEVSTITRSPGWASRAAAPLRQMSPPPAGPSIA